MDKKLAREIVESLPSLYPLMTAEEEEAIWTLLATDLDDSIIALVKALEAEHKKLLELQKALKNVPDTNVGDTISRQSAIADAQSWIAVNGFEQNLQNKVIEWLKEFPSVQPETTTMTVGRTKGEITMWYECDNCGEPVDQSDNYCQKCGRKFR